MCLGQRGKDHGCQGPLRRRRSYPRLWVAYVYAPDRSGERPLEHLNDFTGVLQVDGYSGYRKLARKNTGLVGFLLEPCPPWIQRSISFGVLRPTSGAYCSTTVIFPSARRFVRIGSGGRGFLGG